MDGKARFIFPVIMTGIIVFLVSFLVTFLNVGFPANFLALWLKAFFTGWPMAAAVAFFAVPLARKATERIVARLDGKA
ncbi:MAG: DUF2798 domain-containing protein [Pseudorhodoplanes sp.]